MPKACESPQTSREPRGEGREGGAQGGNRESVGGRDGRGGEGGERRVLLNAFGCGTETRLAMVLNACGCDCGTETFWLGKRGNERAGVRAALVSRTIMDRWYCVQLWCWNI